MADEGISSSVSYEAVETSDPTWKPSEKMVDVVLQPEPGDESYWPASSAEPITAPAASVDAACAVNIETTGLMPFDSRLISISVIDLRSPENVMDFTGKDELQVLEAFIGWYRDSGIVRLVGYNVAFDWRFLFAKCMKFGLVVPDLYGVALTDVQQMMEQVREAFVYGNNRPGKLDEWTMYFFGTSGLLTAEQVLQAWDAGDLESIASHNRAKTRNVTMLYSLVLQTRGDLVE